MTRTFCDRCGEEILKANPGTSAAVPRAVNATVDGIEKIWCRICHQSLLAWERRDPDPTASLVRKQRAVSAPKQESAEGSPAWTELGGARFFCVEVQGGDLSAVVLRLPDGREARIHEDCGDLAVDVAPA